MAQYFPFDGLQAPEEVAWLPGFRWKRNSCCLDALLVINIVILKVLAPDVDGRFGSESEVMHAVTKQGLELLKISWPQLDICIIEKYRDTIREKLRDRGIRIGKKSVLDHLDHHIISSSFVEFPMQINTKCSDCNHTENKQRHLRGLSFYIRKDQSDDFTSIQHVLDRVVHAFLCRLLNLD